MTISEAIFKIDEIKPNTYSQEDKLKWLSTLDGMVKAEVIDTHEGSEDVVFNGYDSNTSLDTELIVKPPYDDIYLRWIEAQIDYHNGEMGKYSNAMAMYNSTYGTWSRWYNRTHMPYGTKVKFF